MKRKTENRPRFSSNYLSYLYFSNPQLFINCLLVLVLFLCSSVLLADVPHPDLLKKISQGEIEEPYYLKNIDRLRAEGVNTPALLPDGTKPALPAANGEANYNAIAILVDFSDNVAQVNASYFDNLLFGTSNGTVRHYYNEVTYGNLTVVTVNLPSSLGWKRAPQTYSYYTNNSNGLGSYPQNAQKLAEDAIALANPYVNFSQYDNNNDGYVDALFIIHAGPGAEFTGNNNHIWSHKWSTHTPQLVDGVYAYIYSMEPEFWQNPGDMTCGVYAHEMGHSVFSLPDVYDRDGSSKGLGRWSLMANGSWNGTLGNSPAHPDAWNRSKMGYVTPVNITSDVNQYPIPNIQNNQVLVRLWRQGQIGNQYFIIENRQRVGYDAALPADGLCIYHVDESVTTQNDREWYPGYTSNGHYLVALEQADGLWSLEKNVNSGNNGDPFPGSTNKTVFDSASTPDSKDYNFTSTKVAVRNISASANVMYADLLVGNPQLAPDIEITPSSFTFHVFQNDTLSQNMQIANTGNANLSWSISELNASQREGYRNTTPIIAASWLSENPTSGVIPAGSGQQVKLLVNAAGMAVGSYVCSLSVSSNDPDENPWLVMVTMNVSTVPVNQPPVAINDVISVNEDQSIIANILSNDYDPDGSIDPSSVVVVSNPQHGIITVDSINGTVTYEPNLNFYGSDQLSYTVQDNQGAISNVAQLSITVNSVNDPPDLSNLPDVFFAEDSSSTLLLNSYVVDVDHSFSQLNFFVQVLTAGSYPSIAGSERFLIDPTDLQITIDPVSHEASFNCTADSSGVFSVRFTVVDDSGATDSDTISVTVHPVNDPPLITELPDSLYILNDSTLTFSIWDFVRDPETPDSSLQYQFSQDPVQLMLNFQNKDGQLQMTPLAGSAGTVRVVMVVTDPEGLSAMDTILVLIEALVDLKDFSQSRVPTEYFLDQNYPNPFNPSTTIRFGLPQPSWIKLEIFNLRGQRLMSIEESEQAAGIHHLTFNATNLASGIYFYRLSASPLKGQGIHLSQMKKMILIR